MKKITKEEALLRPEDFRYVKKYSDTEYVNKKLELINSKDLHEIVASNIIRNQEDTTERDD